MNKIIFPLKLQMQGAGVADLQEGLWLCLDNSIFQLSDAERQAFQDRLHAERIENIYAETTQNLVEVFQKQHQLQPGGSVDEPTAKALNAILEELGAFGPASPDQQRLVGGQVRHADNQPFPGALVRAFDVLDDRGVLRLGEDTTDAEGRYTIRYAMLPGVDAIDLRVVVFDADGKPLRDSDVIRGAKPLEIVDLTMLFVEQPAARVSGIVRHTNGTPLVGALVSAYDKDLRNYEQLGEQATTGQTGRYEITYTAEQFSRAEKGSADLTVRVIPGPGMPEVSSTVIYNAQPVETVNVTVGGEYRGPSEYDELIRELTPARQDVPLHELTAEDVTFLAGDTGQDAQRITWLAESAKRHQEADNIFPQVFYALFRQNLPTELRGLLANDLDVLRRALETSSHDNIIVDIRPNELEHIMANLQQLKVNYALKPAGENKRASLGDLLTIGTTLNTTQQEALADLFVTFKGPAEELWKTATERGFTDQQIADVQSMLELGALTMNHTPLVRKLHQMKPPETGASLRYLADLDKEQWRKLVEGHPVPAEILGETLEEKQNSYAENLQRSVEEFYPTAVIASRIRHDKLPVDAKMRPHLETFFGKNPEFEFGSEYVETYLASNKANLDGIASAVRPGLEHTLLQLERLTKITNHANEIGILLQEEFDSSYRIVSLGKRDFIETMSEKVPGGRVRAETLYDIAEQNISISVALLARYGQQFNSTDVPVLPQQATNVIPAPDPAKGLPDLRILFGNLDFCNCEHCRSVYSPAAYLVDVLQFLKNRDSNLNDPLISRKKKSIRDILFERRPDIAGIELTCENTNVPVPYIDLVNEILENAVSSPTSLPIYQTKRSAEELAANPEYLNIAAYDNFLKQAKFPWSMPFDLWLEEARIYLDYIKSGRVELMETVRPNARFTDNTIAREQLKLSKEDAEFITKANPQNGWTYWGFQTEMVQDFRDAVAGINRSGEWDTLLSNVSLLRQQSGLAYGELLNLLDARYIQTKVIAGQPLTLQGDECNQGTLTLSGLNDTILDRAHRCARLWRRLNWPMYDLDRAINAGSGEIDDEFLLVLSHIERLRDALGVSVATAASWFANIDTQAYIDHTKEGQPQIPAAHDLLFQNRTVLKEADPDFALKSDRTDLVNTSDKITNHTATVIAALGISTTDLTLLIEEGIPDTLGLANLSQLYRAVSLAKALKLSIRDFLTVKKITGITPFPTHPPKISDASRAILEFIEEVQQIRRSGFAIAELDYLLRDRSNVIGGIAPSERLIALVLGEIRDGLQRIARETEIVPDSEGQFLRKSLTLLGWNSELIEQALSAEILGSDLRFEIELLQLPGDPAPSALPTRVPEKFGYDSARKRLFCLGAMRTSEKNKLSAAFLTTAVNFAAYETAVNNLFVLSTANAPTRTDFIKEKMQSFELPTHSAQIKFKATLALGDLPIFPGGVSFVDAVPKELKPRISYNAGTQELVFTGFMTIGERDKLINLAPGASRYGTVIENIYKIRITIPKELTGRFYYDMGDLSLHFVGWMTEAERQRLRGLSTEPSYRAAIDELDQESSNYTEQKPENIFLAAQDAEKLFFDTTTVGKRFEIILNKLMTYLRKRASENLVVEIISRALAIEVQTARLLLLHYMKWPGRSEDAMVAFLDSAFAVSDTKVALTFATFADQFATFALLAKVAQLISRLQVTAAEISWLFPNGADRFNLNNLHAGSSTPVTALYEGWRRLIDLFRLRDTWPGGSNTLSIIFGAAADVGKSEKDLRDLLVEHIGWNASDLEYATGGHTRTPALPQVPPLDLANAGDYGDERKLGQLRTCIDLLKRLGGSAQQIWAWAGESLSEPDARAILQTVRAKFDNATWLERARPLRNVLRERQRAALVDYLVARDQLRQAEDLFGQYLIDVEMSPCQLTSRIKQATNSVQLFVQRCLMNLEQPKISPGSIDLDQWKWMKNYRVWEANRKVFVYPENLIQPELRDDKSPFFRDLEGELQQGDITDQTATSALHNYLEKLDQVARLEIVGMYVGLYNEDEGGSNVLHVFGRTYNTPHIYFYRKLVDSLYWTPWEKVDLDIEGDHLIPVAWHGRLYLFWPIFTEQAKDPDPIVEGKKPAKFWDIQLAWSEKHDDKWSGKQIIPGSLELSPSLVHSTPNGLAISPVAKSELNFRGSEKDGRLVITCRYNIDQTKYNWVMLGQWFFAGNQARSTIIKNSPSGFSIAATPPDSRVYNMMYREREREELGQDYTFALPVGISDEYQLLVSKNLALLAKNPDIFCILYPHQVYDYLLEFSPAHTQLPFFYQDNQHTYFVWRPAQRIDGQNPLLLFEPHFHANVKAFFEATREGGTPELFSLKTQYRPDSGKGKVFGIEVDLPFGATFVNAYEPNFAVQSNGMWSGGVLPSLPNEDVSFSPRDAYSLYNWELFFHIPLLIATRLNKNQRFADAQSWFHSIFDPIGNSNEAEPARFWRFRPFYEHGQGQSIQELMKILADKTNTSSVKQDLINRVYQWRKNPFKPHAIARWRIQSYEWAVVMKYIDNLIEWGDQLFRRETIEAINEAAQLYILAAQILGKRPERILRQAEPQIHTYTTLEPMLDTFSNALVKTENLLSSPPNTGSGTGQGVGLVLTDILYFCIPHNDKLVEYWDKVSDRLFKIRHCMTIEGAIRRSIRRSLSGPRRRVSISAAS